MSAPVAQFRLLVVVGTDHHRFDRLVGWVDRWVADQDGDVGAVVQHGTSAAPRQAEGRRLVGHDELQQLMSSATVVVTHGGPATIVEARRHGKLPVVVPRDPALGEHVDGHQQRFARRLAERDLVVLCEREDELRAALDLALTDSSWLRVDVDGAQPGVTAAVARVGAVIDDLVAQAGGTRTRMGGVRGVRVRRKTRADQS